MAVEMPVLETSGFRSCWAKCCNLLRIAPFMNSILIGLSQKWAKLRQTYRSDMGFHTNSAFVLMCASTSLLHQLHISVKIVKILFRFIFVFPLKCVMCLVSASKWFHMQQFVWYTGYLPVISPAGGQSKEIGTVLKGGWGEGGIIAQIFLITHFVRGCNHILRNMKNIASHFGQTGFYSLKWKWILNYPCFYFSFK